MVSTRFKVDAWLVQWIRRLVCSPNSWVSLMTFWFFDRFGVDPYYVFSFPSLFPSHRLPPFYATLLEAWKAVGGSSLNGSLVVGILASNGPSSVASTSCKSCYELLLSLNPCVPHCIEKFRPSFGDLEWSCIWRSLFLMPLDRQVIDLNWKVAHGVVYTAKRLRSFGYDVPEACFCGYYTESLEHLFFSCPLIQSGIAWIQSLLFASSPISSSLTVRHLLFGFSSDELLCVPRVFSYLLNVCKYLVWIQRNDYRFRAVPPSALGLLATLRSSSASYLPLFFSSGGAVSSFASGVRMGSLGPCKGVSSKSIFSS